MVKPPTGPAERNNSRQPSDAAQWQAVLDCVPGYLVITDRSRRIRLLSRPPLGSGLDEFIGHDMADFVRADQQDVVIRATQEVLAGTPMVERKARSARTGRWFRSRTVGILEQAGVSGLVSHVVDVDDEIRNRAELARLRAMVHRVPSAGSGNRLGPDAFLQRLSLMIESLPFLVAYVDKEHRYQYNNASYENWFGIPRAEMRGRHVKDLLGEAAYALLSPHVAEVLQGNAVEVEVDLSYQSSNTRRVLAYLRPDIDSGGETQGFFVFAQDLTRRRLAEAALRQREHEMRQMQKMEALGRLSGGIAHEFNNLRQTVITGCTGLLVLLREREPEAAQQIGRIRRAARRGASLTRQLLSFSRPAEPNQAPLDVDELIVDMGFLLERLLGASYQLEVGANSGCRVFVDAGEMQQVLMNLAINARDAMPDGGLLRITTQRADVSADEAESHTGLREGAHALITVSDTGIGMDEQTRSRMFDPFFTTKKPDQGTGLGLATVYSIIQRLGGHVDVESAPGRGTTFHLHLPCHE